jgi:hypothetical protein
VDGLVSAARSAFARAGAREGRSRSSSGRRSLPDRGRDSRPDNVPSFHFPQLGRLEKRLSYSAHFALAASAGVGILLALAALRAGGLEAVGWKPYAIVLLSALPATMITLNGLRQRRRSGALGRTIGADACIAVSHPARHARSTADLRPCRDDRSAACLYHGPGARRMASRN